MNDLFFLKFTTVKLKDIVGERRFSEHFRSQRFILAGRGKLTITFGIQDRNIDPNI